MQRGTAMSEFNRFRSDALSCVLDDLVSLEKSGFAEEAMCEKVKHALDVVINAATAIPDGGFLGKPVWKDFSKFKDVYVKWNDVHGGSEDSCRKRQEMLGRLRDRRHKIARRIRKNQHVLANKIDLQLVDGMYGALRDMQNALPDVFKALAKAISRHQSAKED